MQNKRDGYIYLALFALSIPAANWMIGNFGTFCVPDGPCLIPVAPGITAPSGVLMVGAALVLRDLVQRSLGFKWALAAVLVASATAFLLSELADLLVYTPLQKKGLTRAVVASSVVGLIVDSIVFLYLAFGSLDYISGQIIGKMWMVLLAIPLIHFLRSRENKAVA